MLSPWTSFTPFFETRRHDAFAPMLSLLEGFRRELAAPELGRPHFAVDQGPEAWTVTADVPGLTADDVEVGLEDGRLTIRGERKVEPPEGYRLARSERAAFQFERAFRLPASVDSDRIAARVDHGVLTVKLGKRDAAKPRMITVERG